MTGSPSKLTQTQYRYVCQAKPPLSDLTWPRWYLNDNGEWPMLENAENGGSGA